MSPATYDALSDDDKVSLQLAVERQRAQLAWTTARCLRAMTENRFGIITDVLQAIGWTEDQIEKKLYMERRSADLEKRGIPQE